MITRIKPAVTIALSLSLALMLISSPASTHAGTTTATTKATATLASTCQLNVPNIVLGNLALGAANSVRYQAETLSVLCSKNASYTNANVKSTGSGTRQQINYEAAVQTGSWVTPDNYSDNLTLTVSY